MYRWRAATVAMAVAVVLIPVVSVPSAQAATGLTLPRAQAPTGLTVTRVSGADRYATAAAIADAGWPGTLPSGSTVLLATGQNYPDAVAGAAAAGHLGVPLLLSTGASLSASAAQEIRRLGPARVVLLGGTSALSATVASQVAALGVTVVRWSGVDRYATAATISRNTYSGSATNIYLATGKAFPDALAGAALAAVAGGPLLLTEPNSLPPETATEIQRLHPSAIVVLGGTSAVSDAVAGAAVAAAGGAQRSRLAGLDRYQTADEVASTLVQVHGGTTASNGILVATGYDFADALAGAAWAGTSDRPLLLVPNNYVMPHTWQAIQDLRASSAVVLGGVKAVSGAVADGLASGDPPTV